MGGAAPGAPPGRRADSPVWYMWEELLQELHLIGVQADLQPPDGDGSVDLRQGESVRVNIVQAFVPSSSTCNGITASCTRVASKSYDCSV